MIQIFYKRIVLPLLIFSLVLTPVFAETSTPTPTPSPSQTLNKMDALQKQIKEVEEKLSEIGNEKKTLSSQIGAIDSQIGLTELRIQATKQELSALTDDIAETEEKIGNLEASLEQLTRASLNRIVATYQAGSPDPIEMFVSSNSASDYLAKVNYLRLVQAHDKQVLYETQQAKNDYANQKEIFEEKKKKVESLEKQLEDYTAQLDEEKESKEELLAVTQNDERKFQQLLARLKADAESISRAVGSIGYKIGPVKKGDIIGGVGSSGCSTGPHLHFEVFTDAKVENGRIIGTRTDPRPYLESSDYERPVPNYPQNVTTWYGTVYFLGVHTGIDIANPYGTPIKAIADGEAYFTSSPCNIPFAGGSPLGKGIIVDHKNGIVTLSWHIP